MRPVKDLIIKTKENGIYCFKEVKVDMADKHFLIVYDTGNYRICFPLANVLSFSFCTEVS